METALIGLDGEPISGIPTPELIERYRDGISQVPDHPAASPARLAMRQLMRIAETAVRLHALSVAQHQRIRTLESSLQSTMDLVPASAEPRAEEPIVEAAKRVVEARGRVVGAEDAATSNADPDGKEERTDE